MNNKEPNSLNSIQECCAARQTAENALDALHTEAIETELDKLARLEAAVPPGPWSFENGHFRFKDGESDPLRYACLLGDVAEFLLALRNAAPRLIFQAKNIANIVSDLDEVHAALGTDYNSQAAPDVRTLQYRVKSLRRTLTIWLDKISSLRKTVKDLEEQRVKDVQKIEVRNKSLETEQTINENLRGTVAALREKLESCGNTSALERNLENQSETIQCLWKERDELRNQLKDRQAYRVKLERELRGYRLDSLASLNSQAQTIREYKELNTRVNSEVLALRERERQLLSSLASVRRQNDNLCAANLERFERIKQLERDLSAERSEKTRLQGLLDLAKKELGTKDSRVVRNISEALHKKVRCPDGAVRELRVLSATEGKYNRFSNDGRLLRNYWRTRGFIERHFIGGTILD